MADEQPHPLLLPVFSSPPPSKFESGLGFEPLDFGEAQRLFGFNSDADLIPQLQDEAYAMPPALRHRGVESNVEPVQTPEFGEAVQACFPDICRKYIVKLGRLHQWNSASAITFLLDELENDRSYPKLIASAKRKRPNQEEENEEEQARRTFEAPGKRHLGKDRNYIESYTNAARSLLKSSYPLIYSQDVDRVLFANNNRLYPTYLHLYKLDPAQAPNAGVRFKKRAVKGPSPIDALSNSSIEAEQEAVREFLAASAMCESEAAKEAEEKQKQEEEAENFKRAKTEGTISECGCCFDEQPRNRMVHCNGDVLHWFCRGCARRMAESQIGLSKYHLACMSMEGCDATFDNEQKRLFLDDKLLAALDRIEQEAVIRMAGIENLETCPFCPFAAECPPVEEDKEFRCANPECELVSCRLCRQETHIPKTCEEAAREMGYSARRTLEEAMSAALIRKCNKCGTPFIKEYGCNKMTCTRAGCMNTQCYVCSKSCDYSHFDDPSRGGKKGNCPLFDNVEQRHGEEVRAAEENVRKQLTEENPGLDSEALKFNFSEKVKEDEARRRPANPVVVRQPLPAHAPIRAARVHLWNQGQQPRGAPRHHLPVLANVQQDQWDVRQLFREACREFQDVHQKEQDDPHEMIAGRRARGALYAHADGPPQHPRNAGSGPEPAGAVPDFRASKQGHLPGDGNCEPPKDHSLRNRLGAQGHRGAHTDEAQKAEIPQASAQRDNLEGRNLAAYLQNEMAQLAGAGLKRHLQQVGTALRAQAVQFQNGLAEARKVNANHKVAELLANQYPQPRPVPDLPRHPLVVRALGPPQASHDPNTEQMMHHQQGPLQFALPVLSRGPVVAGNHGTGWEYQAAAGGEQNQQQPMPQPKEVIDLTGDGTDAPGRGNRGKTVFAGGPPVNDKTRLRPPWPAQDPDEVVAAAGNEVFVRGFAAAMLGEPQARQPKQQRHQQGFRFPKGF